MMKQIRRMMLAPLLALIAATGVFPGTAPQDRPVPDRSVRVGMSFREFTALYPEASIMGGTGQWNSDASVQGLPGSWAYDFKDGRLQWYQFNSYVSEINEKNFTRCLDAAVKIIEKYKKIYGSPYIHKEGKKIFIDPYTSHHWGYPVLRAVWKTGSEHILVSYQFFGGKGEYHFIVKIETHDAGYTY